MLSEALIEHGVSPQAPTPEGLKDPADFITARFRRRNCESFRREIVEPPATGRIGICSDCLRPYRNKRDVLAVLGIYLDRRISLPALDPADRTKRAEVRIS
jgi:hypothetical protein